MAGSNQAIGLGGMLSQIGNSLGSGYSQQMMDKLGGNIERMSKPELDMNDPESVEANARWYQSTGKDREAMMMAEKAASMRKEQSAMEAMVIASGNSEKAAAAAQGGDVRLVNQQISTARTKMQEAAKAGDAQQVKVYQQQIQQLQPLVQQAQGVSTGKQASAAMQYEEMLDPAYRRVDQRTGQEVPLTDEQRAGIQRQYDTMLQNPEVRKQYVNGKVQLDQVRRMEQSQADEGKIAESSKNIFSAETEAAVDEALQEAINDPDLSPSARQAVIQQANAQTAFLGRKAERAERAAELNTPVITKEEYDTQRGSIDAMPDGPAKKRLLASLEGVYETQKKIDEGGIGFASKSAREQLAKTLNKIDQQVMSFESADLASQRQLAQSEANRNAATYQEAKINAAMGPSTQEVTRYMNAQDEAGNPLSYEEAEKALQAQLNLDVAKIRAIVDPEDEARIREMQGATNTAAVEVAGTLTGEYTEKQRLKVATFMLNNNLSEDDAVPLLRDAGLLPKNPESVMKKARSNQPLGEGATFSNMTLRPRGF